MPRASAYDESYPTCSYTHAWLRVMGEDVDPDEVTAIVGVSPTSTQRRGNPVEGHPGKTYSRGGWWIGTEGLLGSKDARHHLDWILEKVPGKEQEFMELHRRGYLVDVCVRWDSRHGHGGPTISPKQMKALADLGVDLWFDVYVADFED
ncbi:DUF4279 domain-containing protein [Luteolibacter luteus]|uniref:DUF4279 domain-containing protein n=1 Tax=Luteolibacter luteus TaxID=2728835 RepID=A0A858RMM3_9BACT|nr:DUF4279 domain-containing protein [Luteolibacter luteus]QJE97708.1 DUF4279 domain-containing protein [Luteolibacter luteus]